MFSWNSPRSSGLVKFRDVYFDDASVHSYFCSILISIKGVFLTLITLPAKYEHPVLKETVYGPFGVRINGVGFYHGQ